MSGTTGPVPRSPRENAPRLQPAPRSSGWYGNIQRAPRQRVVRKHSPPGSMPEANDASKTKSRRGNKMLLWLHRDRLMCSFSIRTGGTPVPLPAENTSHPRSSVVMCGRILMSAVHSHLKDLDYSVVQQCMHCGLCLPTCPTYDATKLERNSPRGRIALMRAIADGRLEPTKAFADEMYFCLGCLACMTACPAGVNYAELFEHARAEAEQSGALHSPRRSFIRSFTLSWLFMDLNRLRLAGRALRLYQQLGLQTLVRRSGFLKLLPKRLRELESMTPTVQDQFSSELISPTTPPVGPKKYRVAVLTGCAQDLICSDVNCDTVEVLARNGCEVLAPPEQDCCGSLHAHNGEWELAQQLARRNIDQFPPEQFDAIITNAGGCGSHLKHYAKLLADDPAYRDRATLWDAKVKDIHEWLVDVQKTGRDGRRRVSADRQVSPTV